MAQKPSIVISSPGGFGLNNSNAPRAAPATDQLRKRKTPGWRREHRC